MVSICATCSPPLSNCGTESFADLLTVEVTFRLSLQAATWLIATCSPRPASEGADPTVRLVTCADPASPLDSEEQAARDRAMAAAPARVRTRWAAVDLRDMLRAPVFLVTGGWSVRGHVSGGLNALWFGTVPTG